VAPVLHAMPYRRRLPPTPAAAAALKEGQQAALHAPARYLIYLSCDLCRPTRDPFPLAAHPGIWARDTSKSSTMPAKRQPAGTNEHGVGYTHPHLTLYNSLPDVRLDGSGDARALHWTDSIQDGRL